MVFGKGLDPVPQAIVERQRAGYEAEQAELTARLAKEARREELMNTALQGIATQGMADILGRQKEARDWQRRQEEYDIKEEMLIRQEARAEERGIESAERKRMITLEEEMVKLAAQDEGEIKAQLSIEILSGIRSQASWNSQPLAAGGTNTASAIEATVKAIKNLDDQSEELTDPTTLANIRQARLNLSTTLKELNAEANTEQQLREEGQQVAKQAYARSGSKAGMLDRDRDALFGQDGWINKLAEARGRTITKLMAWRRAQYEALRIKQGGPELPEALRRNAAFEDESTNARLADKARKTQEAEDAPGAPATPRPGRRRRSQPGRLPEASGGSTTREKDFVSDVRHLLALNKLTGDDYTDPTPAVGDIEDRGGATDEDKGIIAEKIYRRLTDPTGAGRTVREALGYPDTYGAAAPLKAAVGEERKQSQAGIDAGLKRLISAHRVKGSTIKLAQESARQQGINDTLRFLMNDAVVKRLQEQGAKPTPSLVRDMWTRASGMFDVLHGDDVDAFVKANPRYKPAHKAIENSREWMSVIRAGKPVTIADVMGYAMIEDVANFMDTSKITDLAGTKPKHIRYIASDATNESTLPGVRLDTGTGAADVLATEAMQALKSLQDGKYALYSVAAGRANTGGRLGRSNPNYGHGKNGLRLSDVIDDASSMQEVADLYTEMMTRARKEGVTVTLPSGSRWRFSGGGEEVLVVSHQNYQAFRKAVRSRMMKRIAENKVYQTLVLMGRR